MRAEIACTQKHINVIANLNKKKLQKLYKITEIEEKEKKHLPKL